MNDKGIDNCRSSVRHCFGMNRITGSSTNDDIMTGHFEKGKWVEEGWRVSSDTKYVKAGVDYFDLLDIHPVLRYHLKDKLGCMPYRDLVSQSESAETHTEAF